MNVICVGGDGDGTAIGGNHFIHACRRNIDMTYVLMNNYIYGMTGGQFSPCTPTGDLASTTPYGNPDPIFDISKLAIGAGATFVARTTAMHPRQIDKLIVQGIKHKGMAIIEVLDDCPTTYGRRNKFRSVIDMMKRLKADAVPVKAAAKMTAEQLEGKFLTGVLFEDTEKPEYTAQYENVIKKAQGA
jgi:2-oxoglutarate ferredoxin oxidoreductase subunit beta